MACPVSTRPCTTASRAEGAVFEQGLRAFFAHRDLGVRAATGGAFGAHVIRAVPSNGASPQWHTHDLEFQLVYVLRGWLTLTYQDIGAVTFRPGDSRLQPPMVRHVEVAHSDVPELLAITAPAKFKTAAASSP